MKFTTALFLRRPSEMCLGAYFTLTKAGLKGINFLSLLMGIHVSSQWVFLGRSLWVVREIPGKKDKGILFMHKERLFLVCPCRSWSKAMLPWTPYKQLELEVGWIRKTLKWYLRGMCLLLYIFLMVLFKANTLPPDIVSNLFHSLTYNWCICQEAPSWGEGYAWVWFSEDLSQAPPWIPRIDLELLIWSCL